MSIQEEAVLVRLSISQWTARKFDKVVSEETARRYNASPDAGRYNKVLIAKEAISEISRVASEARDFHYKNTVPWDDGGSRLLPSKNFMEYTKQMREFRSRFDEVWNRFVSEQYLDLKEKARESLRYMFREDDYPSKNELYSKYSFDVDIDPVPSASDFRVSLSDKEKSRIQKELEARVNERLVDVTRDLFDRLIEVIGRFVDKLSEADTIFRNSLVTNIEDLVVLLPKLNINNDPTLKKAISEIKAKVLVYEPDQLRSDKDARKTAAKDAKAILDKMSGYLGSVKA